MQNTQTISLSKFECRLVNSFGDGHNHELAQYENLAASMKSLAAVKRFDGVLLGNVYCDNVSLDSLLLTSFGIFIIEFKSYPKAASIRITGQKEFQCLNASGERMTLTDGSFLNVKGGSLASPYDQAKKNRIAVFNTLKRLFGEERAKAINIGVAIVFNGSVAIEGLDRIIEAERRWLTIVDSNGFYRYISNISIFSDNGLSTSECEKLISHMDANEAVPEKANLYQQAWAYYDMLRYEEAFALTLRCDSLDPNVIRLKLLALFHSRNDKKYSKLFHQLLAENLNCSHPALRSLANKLLGFSFLRGIHGIAKNEEKALEYLELSGDRSEEVTVAISSLKEKFLAAKKKEEELIRQKAAWRKEEKRKEDFKDQNSKALSGARRSYSEIGRVVITSLIIITALNILASIMPSNGVSWHGLANIFSLIAICGILLWIRNEESVDFWFVCKNPLRHVKMLPYRTITISEYSFTEGDRLWKTILHTLAVIGYFAVPMILCYRILKAFFTWMMSAGFIFKAVVKIIAVTSLNPLNLILLLLAVYFIVNLCGIGYMMYIQMMDTDKFCMVHDGKNYCYLTAIPDIRKDMSEHLESSVIVMCAHGLAFSAGLGVLICILSALRPILYKLLAILF